MRARSSRRRSTVACSSGGRDALPVGGAVSAALGRARRRSPTGSACRSGRASARCAEHERRAAAADGAQDVALLRDVRHRGGRLAAARQLSGRRGRAAPAGAAHVADQHRHEPAVHAGRARSGLPARPTRWSSGSRRTLRTLESLERYQGHLLNWYDTATRAPLHPRYVSTVDSGNLAGRADRAGAGPAGSSSSRPQTRRAAARGAGRHGGRACARRVVVDDAGIGRAGRPLTAINGLARAMAVGPPRPAARHRVAGWRRSRLTRRSSAAALELDRLDRTPRARRGRVLVPRRAGRRWTTLARDPPSCRRALHALAARMRALADGMRFDFLYDRRRRIFAIGYRLADADGPGRLDRVVLRPAGVRSAAGQLRGDRQGRRAAAPLVPPRTPGDQRRRPRRADLLGRHDVRVPDAAAPDAELPRHAARSELPRRVRRQIDYGRAARRAVGHLGVGLRVHRPRGHLSVPRVRRARARAEARARHRSGDCAVRHGARQPGRSPAAAAENFDRLADAGPGRALRVLRGGRLQPAQPRRRAARRQPPCAPSSSAPTSPTTRACRWWRSPTSSARTCSSTRFHADPRVQATELLLQERVPREAILSEPRPAETATAPPSLPVFASRRFLSPQSASVHTHFLSNGRYTTAVTNAGGGYSMWRDLAVTRRRDDPTSDAGAHFIYLRDPWSGRVWSATHQPVCQRAGPVRGDVRSRQDHVPPPRRRHRDAARHHRVVRGRRRGAAADAHEPRQPDPRARGDELRRDRAGAAGGRLRAPGVRQAVRRVRVRSAERRSAVHPPAAGGRRVDGGGLSRARRGRAASGRVGRVGNRPRAVPRPRPLAGEPASCSTAVPCRARPAPCSIRSARCASASGWRPAPSSASPSPRASRPIARRRWRWRASIATAARRRAPSRWPSRTSTSRCSTWG